MKRTLAAVVFVLAIIVLVAWYLEHRASDLFTIGRYTYTASTNGSFVVTDDVILNGIQLSLLQSKMNPDAWVVSRSSVWQPTNSFSGTIQKPMHLHITLSNQADKRQLYVRVNAVAVSNGLEYHLYRSK